ncbi:MAG: hypothetical protein EA370_07260 [Wenzhouxiangella sp.]|nr:MAG: hypothetical protein EA370_07260 [Wenzhouxiangella sp.]
MYSISRSSWAVAVVLTTGLATTALASELVDLAPGNTHDGHLETRNHPISIGDQARVEGRVTSGPST